MPSNTLQDVELEFGKLQAQWLEEQRAGRLGSPEKDSQSKDIKRIIDSVENYVRSKKGSDAMQSSQRLKDDSFIRKCLRPFLRRSSPSSKPVSIPLASTSRVLKVIKDGEKKMAVSTRRRPYNGLCLIALHNSFPFPISGEDVTRNVAPGAMIKRLIDPAVYEAGPLLCDVAKAIYDTLELVEGIDDFKPLFHATLRLSRLTEELASNMVLYPREAGHKHLLMSMFCTARFCRELVDEARNASKSEFQRQLKSLDSFVQGLQAEYDGIAVLQEQRRNLREGADEVPYRSRVTRDDIGIGSASVNQDVLEPGNIQKLQDPDEVVNLKDDSELAIRERAEKFDILAEYGVKKDALNTDTLMSILTENLGLKLLPGPIEREGLVEGGSYGLVIPARLSSSSKKSKKVAVKIFHAKHLTEQHVCLRILREARSWRAALSGSHVNKRRISPLLGITNNLGDDYEYSGLGLVSVWRDDGDIEGYINRTGIGMTERIRLATEVAEGLEYLHTRVPQLVHGDLKGSNILIMLSRGKFGRETMPHIQLCDFGLTRVHDNSFGLSSAFTTTRRFEAPELRKTKTFTSASDMCAFGGVLLQVLYSLYPFDKMDPDEVEKAYSQAKTPADFPKPDRVSKDHWEFMQKCWLKTPADRPSASKAIRQLKNFLSSSRSTIS